MNVRRFEWTITKARQNTDRFILQQGVILNKVNEKSIGSRGVATSCFRDPAACFISEISFITAGPLILCKPDLGLISMNLVAKHHQRGENLTCLGFVFLQDCEGVIALTVFGWRNVKEQRSGVHGSMTLEKLFESTRTWQVEGSQHAGVELNKFSRVLNLFTVQFPKCGRASFIFCGQHADMIRASVCETGKDGVQGKARFPAWGKNSFKSSFTGSD